MPTYALLGATGSTGSAIIRSLLTAPPQNLTLNIFVRSKYKLLQTFPDLETTTAFKANIIEGTPENATALQQCLEDVDVVFGCIGTNISTPGISLIEDTATAIISALSHHKSTQGAAYKAPTVIQLRSASLNPTLKAQMSWAPKTMAAFCFRYVYEDLKKACDLFASKSPSLLTLIVVDPPSIHDPDGTTATGYELIVTAADSQLGGQGSYNKEVKKQEEALMYADLGAAFCEVAERKGEFVGKAVGPSATGKVELTWGILMGYMATAVKGRVWG